MMVFTLPSFPYVFKVMRDVFKPPKQTTHAEVRAKYQLVKHHDRVGRMADTLEFSSVAFPVARLGEECLAELEAECGSQVERDGDRVVIGHLYIERRMTPLDLFLRDADDGQARRVVEELGAAIRELAEADVFPGDILCKNFGVTRSGRVVFYDYDEIASLGELTFRRMPAAASHAEEVSAEPWFYVGPNDAFPEEWPTFMFANARDREHFVRTQPDLVDPAWWSARQEDVRRGRNADLLPYPEQLRFSVRFGATA